MGVTVRGVAAIRPAWRITKHTRRTGGIDRCGFNKVIKLRKSATFGQLLSKGRKRERERERERKRERERGDRDIERERER